MLYHIYIVTLLLELFHTVQCISSIMSNVLVICIFRLYVVKSYQEKMHDFLSRKVFACVLWSSLSASPLVLFLFPLRWTTYPYAMNFGISLMKLSLYCPISLYFILVCLVGLLL